MPMTAEPQGILDSSFSDDSSVPTPWRETLELLQRAELYWLTTVRADGRPHVTPLIGVVLDGSAYFCTGLLEQKARNLDANRRVALTTGTNTWAQGLDIVVEGTSARITDKDELQRIADAYEDKYGSEWHFDVGDDAFGTGPDRAAVFRVEAAKVLAFAKDPHGQTTYRLDAGQ